MKKLYYVLNGPNINLTGIREPEHYGKEDYSELVKRVKSAAGELGVKVKVFQSNHEGDLVDKIHEAYRKGASGIVINPGAYTHTSIALLDAVKATSINTAEVHISDVSKREDFRRISYIGMAAKYSVIGRGIQGYVDALNLLVKEQ